MKKFLVLMVLGSIIFSSCASSFVKGDGAKSPIFHTKRTRCGASNGYGTKL